MSRPTVVTVGMVAPPNRGSLISPRFHGTHVPGGGAVHSIKTGLASSIRGSNHVAVSASRLTGSQSPGSNVRTCLGMERWLSVRPPEASHDRKPQQHPRYLGTSDALWWAR